MFCDYHLKAESSFACFFSQPKNSFILENDHRHFPEFGVCTFCMHKYLKVTFNDSHIYMYVYIYIIITESRQGDVFIIYIYIYIYSHV